MRVLSFFNNVQGQSAFARRTLVTARTGIEGLESVAMFSPDLVVLPDLDGLDDGDRHMRKKYNICGYTLVRSGESWNVTLPAHGISLPNQGLDTDCYNGHTHMEGKRIAPIREKIQIGGLGFMTFATMFAIILGRKITIKDRLLLQEALNQVSVEGVVRLKKSVLKISFAIEAIGVIILTLRWYSDFGFSKALYYGVFHSISAFNTAGFDLFGNFSSLTAFVGDPIINITIMLLIICGGLGFVVLAERIMIG